MSLLYQQKKNLHTEYKFNPIRHSEMAWTKSIFYYVFEICVAIKMKIFEDVRVRKHSDLIEKLTEDYQH
ncbi:hypothetical protein T4B_10284 [Trichinella pseudospiralis]|uniref:Uncharacterized protein n=1 Tax=Trichinella pseudospiralis TaxID=6337 RepID=A0A0V1EID7_TRIPS|nr:hypothetical protein T4A_14213 [Trichinella pseudospiralis]KRZ22569.1 hypothetical protein T4B_10284 [Trichinella pseudospiralis]